MTTDYNKWPVQCWLKKVALKKPSINWIWANLSIGPPRMLMATREVGTDHPIRCRINGLALFSYGRMNNRMRECDVKKRNLQRTRESNAPTTDTFFLAKSLSHYTKTHTSKSKKTKAHISLGSKSKNLFKIFDRRICVLKVM